MPVETKDVELKEGGPTPSTINRGAAITAPRLEDKRSCLCCMEWVEGQASLSDKEPSTLCGCCNLYFVDTRQFQLQDNRGRLRVSGPCTKLVVVHDASQAIDDRRTGFCLQSKVCSTLTTFDKRKVKEPPMKDATSLLILEDGKCQLGGCDCLACVAGSCYCGTVGVALEQEKKVEPCCCVSYGPIFGTYVNISDEPAGQA